MAMTRWTVLAVAAIAASGAIGLAHQQAPPRAPITGAIAPPDDVAAVPKDAERSNTGLAWKIIRAGDGKKHPSTYSNVTVDYTGWTREGRMFTTTLAKSKPETFSIADTMKGWREGIPMMVTGEIRRFWIPGDLAYNGVANMPQGMLVFDVELISMK